MATGSRRAVMAALAANAGIAIAKFVGFALTGASSMLAEAVHSVADSGNQALLLFGSASAAREATAEHPFGYGRERYFWAFVVALVLFSLGGVFAIYEGIDKLRHPHPIEAPLVALAVLVFGFVLEALSFRTAIREARPLRGDHGWWAFIRHTKAAELPVVLLEDLGALLGLIFALLGVGLSLATGDGRFDAIGSMAIGGLLTAIAVVLAVEMRSLLIGESAGPERVARMRQLLEAAPALQRVIHMKTTHLGPDELLVAVKAEFDSQMGFAELCDAIDAAENALRTAIPEARVIYIEPAVYKKPAASG